MSTWTVAAAALMVGLLPLLVVVWRCPPLDGVVALELGGVAVTLLMLVLGEVYADASFADLGVVLAMLGLGSGLVFVRFLERWI